MEKIQTLAVIKNNIFESDLFHYLDDKERQEILERFLKNTSFCIGFYRNEKCHFAAVIDIEDRILHIRRMAGSVAKFAHYLDKILVGMCKALNYIYITGNHEGSNILKLSSKLGYHINPETPCEVIKKVS